MSATTAKYLCEVCNTPIPYRGGPHKPRWCDDHREQERNRASRARQLAYEYKAKPVGRKALCTECDTRLLRASPHGLCGFCLVELGYCTESHLLKKSADLYASMDS